MMMGKILEFIAIYALSSDKFYHSSDDDSFGKNSQNSENDIDDYDEEFIPNYKKPINYDEDDD